MSGGRAENCPRNAPGTPRNAGPLTFGFCAKVRARGISSNVVPNVSAKLLRSAERWRPSGWPRRGMDEGVDLLTFGHGTLPQQECGASLAGDDVERLVDVRRALGSCRPTHFSREA